MIRSFSTDDLRDAVSLYPEINGDLDCEEWVANTNNVMLREGDSTGLFAYEYPGLYTGHYFFRVRGREALNLAKAMLTEAFENYGAQAIRGMTKTDNRPALWITRQLGFKSYGRVVTENGEHEIFCLTRDKFLKDTK
jgi:RimJ/RimL family protein N-acetyltransferase